MDSISWENPPERFVDGCELLEGCYRTYKLGPTGYQLYGEAAAFYYPAQKFKNITFTFDPATMDSKGNMSTLLSDILMFYEEILSDVETYSGSDDFIKLFPNPATDVINIEIDSKGTVNARLIDMVGNLIQEKSFNQQSMNIGNITFNVEDLPGGIYFIRVETQSRVYSKLAVISR